MRRTSGRVAGAAPPADRTAGVMSDTAMEAFAEALAKFQAEIPAVGKDQTAKVKTKQGGEYAYSYTDLSTIAAKALPLLAKHGLSWTARPTMTEHGFVLAYSLLHSGGHREGGFYPLPDPSNHGAQEIGSAITYARRYSLCAVTGIAPGGEDDDGQAAQHAKAAPRQQRQPLSDIEEQKARVWAAAKARGFDASDLASDFAREYNGLPIGDASRDQLAAYAHLLETGEAA